MWETLQKFGLAYCDLPTMMWNVEVLLRVIAVKIDGRAQPIPKIIYVLTVTVIAMYSFSYHASTLVFVLVACRETGDMFAGIMVLSITMTSLIGFNKLLCMYRLQQKVQSLVAGYIAYDRQPLPKALFGLMATIMTSIKKRFLLCFGVMMGNSFMFNIQPLIAFMLPAGLDLYDAQLVYGFKYFLGITNYQIILIHVITSTTFICYVTSSITGLLIVTTGYSEARLLVHGQEMRDLWTDALGHYRDNFDETYTDKRRNKIASEELNKYVKHRLTSIVKSHANNIDLTKKIEDIFCNAILVEFILLTVCLITDLLGGLEVTYILLPYALMQVGMDCYVGQKLMDSSCIFENAVYDCKWENFDVQNRKTVLMILKMSQRPLSLSAGGVATLTFTSLMTVYKAVYSAYTALRSTMV